MVKFMYLRDPSFRKNRTMTIARKRISDTQMEIAYSINLVEKDPYASQSAGYVPRELEVDSFSKKIGRAIAAGRLEAGQDVHVVTRNGDERFDVAILRFLQDDSPNFFANKIGRHYLKLREISSLAQAA